MQQRKVDKSIPILRNRLHFFLVWHRRERAMRCWVTVMISAARSRNRFWTRPVSHKDRTRADEAVRIWHTVRSGFSPPPLLMDLRQKQMAYRRNDQMPTKRLIIPNLEMAQPQFIFFILKTALHVPAGKTDMQQYFQGYPFRSITATSLPPLGR